MVDDTNSENRPETQQVRLYDLHDVAIKFLSFLQICGAFKVLFPKSKI